MDVASVAASPHIHTAVVARAQLCPLHLGNTQHSHLRRHDALHTVRVKLPAGASHRFNSIQAKKTNNRAVDRKNACFRVALSLTTGKAPRRAFLRSSTSRSTICLADPLTGNLGDLSRKLCFPSSKTARTAKGLALNTRHPFVVNLTVAVPCRAASSVRKICPT